jgi:cytochrome P450
MAGMVKQRRTAPTDDLLGALVRAHDEGDRPSDGELVELAVTILVAGHETTMSQIGNMTYTPADPSGSLVRPYGMTPRG